MSERRQDKNIKKSAEIPSLYKNYIVRSKKASEIEPAIQPWLWPGYIPLETCTLMAGRGGVGKSQFLMWLSAMITNGTEFKIGNESHSIPQGNVIILSAEDDESYTIVPRLIANDANLENIHILQVMVDQDLNINERFIQLDKDLLAISDKIKEIGNVKVIIFDPITAYIGDIRENRSSEVRNLIIKLNKLAKEHQAACLINTHIRKSNSSKDQNTSAVDEIMGSSAWANTVRMTFAFTRHHEDKNLFVLTIPKTNHKTPESLSYRIIQKQIDYHNLKIETSKIEWSDIKIDMTADEAIDKNKFEQRRDIDVAKELIVRELTFGSKSSEEMKKIAENNEISEITLKRARQELNRSGTTIVMEPSSYDRRKMMWYIGKCTK